MRNPSKNTCKKIMRRAWQVSCGGLRYNPDNAKEYFLFNTIGARLYIMSKHKICNLEPKGYVRHCKKQIDFANDFKILMQ